MLRQLCRLGLPTRSLRLSHRTLASPTSMRTSPFLTPSASFHRGADPTKGLSEEQTEFYK